MDKNGICNIPTTSGSLRPVLARTTVTGRNRLPGKRVMDLDKPLCQKAGRKEGRVQKAKPCRLQLLSKPENSGPGEEMLRRKKQ